MPHFWPNLPEVGSLTGQGKKRDAARLNALALNPERPELETRDRLAALMGGPGNVDEAVEKCKWKQLQSRTYHVPNTAKLEGKADVFILLNHADVSTPKSIRFPKMKLSRLHLQHHSQRTFTFS